MKSSPYITWAKERAGLRYTLARSGAPLCTEQELGAQPEDLQLCSGDEDGWMPLREAVGNRYGVSADQVALTHGATHANMLVAALLLDDGDAVLFERPGYGALFDLLELQGTRVVRFERHGSEDGDPLVGSVERALVPHTRLVVLSNPHNPTGRHGRESELAELGALAEVEGIHVLVDEIYMDLAEPDRIRSAAALSPRFLATGSLTKSFGLGAVRLGWVLGEADLAERIRRLNDLFTLVIAHPSERLALRALETAEAILTPRRELLRRNRPIVDAFVASRSELTWTVPEVGTVGWVCLQDASPDDLAALLEREYESSVAPGRFFDVPDHFRIGFAMPEEDLEEALDRLGQALDRLA
ncbi:pyridoxal phosphate-dependent aminotransferase [Gemmatimonadota bacterium]